MSDSAYFEQQKRIAEARRVIFEALDKSGERDISILIAAFAECIKKASDWNLAAELEAAAEDQG